jgi:hypothetical protein
MLDDIGNPLKKIYIDKVLNKEIKLNYMDNDYKSANKP